MNVEQETAPDVDTAEMKTVAHMLKKADEYRSTFMPSSRSGQAFPYFKAKKRRVIRKRDHKKVLKADR